MTTGHKQYAQRTPHTHKELIKSWADGAIIQYKSHVLDSWEDCMFNEPSWSATCLYRIKPEPKPDFSKLIGLYEGDGYHDTSSVHTTRVPQVKIDDAGQWNLCNKLELIFDGETKELKDVKIHGKA